MFVRRRNEFVAAEFEALEARTLMSVTQFASVGLAFDTQDFDEIETTLFATEGSIDTVSGDVDGATFAAGPSDRFAAGPLLYGNIEAFQSGTYRRHPTRGTQGEPDEVNGARFLSSEGFSAGWWFGDYGPDEEEVEWIVERPDDAVRADFQGTWRFSLIGNRNDIDDFYNGYGELVIDSQSVRYFVEHGSIARSSSQILLTNSEGLLKTTVREYFYLSRDKSVLIFADMEENDQQGYIGVAVREHSDLSFEEVQGDYILAWAFADGPADFSPNHEVDYEQRYLRLESDGDYRIWDLDDYDSGFTSDHYVINRGEWFVVGDELVLDRDDSDDQSIFQISPNGSTLVGLALIDGDDLDPVLGLATRAFPEGVPPEVPPGVFTVSAIGQGGESLVYEFGPDGVWEVIDLIAEAGGPAITGNVVTWIDPKDGRGYAAAVGVGGVMLYTEPATGDWFVQPLLSTPSPVIAGDLEVMIDPDGTVSIVGLNDEGHLIRFYQNGGLSESGFDWSVQDIEAEELAPAGETTPAFVGPLVAYATSWGGLNVAGLDSDGRIWSVWWAPDRTRWMVSDLSESSGAGPLAGGLTVYLTPWDGINLAGIDDAGDLQVTWWVPGFGGNWRQDNLTEQTGGPHLRPGSVTSYVSSWGGLNIVGFDEATGEVMVYWWAPDRVEEGWAVTSLSDSVPPGSVELTGETLEGVAASDGSLNVFGYSDDGSFICYYWQPGFGGLWQTQNLTVIAVDL